MIRFCSIVAPLLVGAVEGQGVAQGDQERASNAATSQQSICSASWQAALAKELENVEPDILNGSWATRCAREHEGLGTTYERGVLSVPPSAVERWRGKAVNQIRGQAVKEEATFDVIWVYDVEAMVQGPSDPAQKANPNFFVRESQNTTWHIPLALVSIVVTAGLLIDVHFDPRAAPDTARGAKSPPSSAPSIYVLLLDSVSWSSFAALMPMTAAFLASLDPNRGQRYRSFAFEHFHTVQYGGTFESMFALWFGGLVLPRKRPDEEPCMMRDPFKSWGHWSFNSSDGFSFSDPSRHLYRLFREAGFWVGSSGTTNWRSRFPTHLSEIVVDRTLPNLTPLMPHFAKTPMPDRDRDCLGHLPPVLHHLRFNERFLERGSGDAPRFLYSHFAAGHHENVPFLERSDETRFHAVAVRSYDLLILEHLKRVFALDPPPIVILMSDHGVLSPRCENKRPILYFLLPSTRLAEAADPDAGNDVAPAQLDAAVVAKNTRLMVTPWDLYVTLRHLTWLGGQAPNTTDLFGVQGLQARGLQLCNLPSRGSKEPFALNLRSFRPSSLFRRIPQPRTCDQLGIAPSNCGHTFDWTHTTDCSNAKQVCLDVGMTFAVIALMHIHKFLEAALLKTAEKPCLVPLLFGWVDSYKVNTHSGACAVTFAVLAGNPYRRFEAVFKDCTHSSPDGWREYSHDGVNIWHMDLLRKYPLESLLQLTKYAKYEECAPARTAPFCVCGEDKKEIETVWQSKMIPGCWTGGYTFEQCCNSLFFVPTCWDETYTFEKCCGMSRRIGLDM